MSDLTIFQEREMVSPLKKVDNQSLERRLGIESIKKGITTEEQLLPFFSSKNQVVAGELMPERTRHTCSWRFLPFQKEGSKGVDAYLSDRFSVPSLKKSEDKEFGNKIIQELSLIPNGIDKAETIPSNLANLKERVGELDGWMLSTDYHVDRMDGWNRFAVRLSKDFGGLKASVVLQPDYNYSTFNVLIPVGQNFEEKLKEVNTAFKTMSNWLNLSYFPNLSYEFSTREDQVDNSPSVLASTFPDYFFKTLDLWRSIGGIGRLRAIIGRSTDEEKPILLLEDPSLTLSYSMHRGLDQILRMGGSSGIGMVISSHADIYDNFRSAVRSGKVNQELSNLFPSDDFNDPNWLHMFVRLEDGKVKLVEDSSSNQGKESVKEVLPLIEKQYGVTYGGIIDEHEAEREARAPMLMQIINEQTAVIQEKLGPSSAHKFRGIARAALINKTKSAEEKYEAYLEILQAEQG